MPFEKGNKLGKGRKIGSKNVKDNTIKDKLKGFFEHNLENLQSTFDKLDDSQQVKVMMDLAPFFVAKLKQVEIEQYKHNEQNQVELTAKEVEIIVKELEQYY